SKKDFLCGQAFSGWGYNPHPVGVCLSLHGDLAGLGLGPQRHGNRQNAVAVQCRYPIGIDRLGQAEDACEAAGWPLAMMVTLPLFQAGARALTLDRQGIVLHLDLDCLRVHPRQLDGEHVRVCGFADVYGWGPGEVAIVRVRFLAQGLAKERGQLPLGFCQLAHRIPIIALHIWTSCDLDGGKVSRHRAMSRERPTWSEVSTQENTLPCRTGKNGYVFTN